MDIANMGAALEAYLEAIRTDYKIYTLMDGTSDIKLKQMEEFNSKLRYTDGQTYIKVISGGGVHSFIVKEDGVKFKRGDILKPAGWQAPAKNQARGNIFGEYHINWTGPDYLR